MCNYRSAFPQPRYLESPTKIDAGHTGGDILHTFSISRSLQVSANSETKASPEHYPPRRQSPQLSFRCSITAPVPWKGEKLTCGQGGSNLPVVSNVRCHGALQHETSRGVMWTRGDGALG